MKRLKMFCVLIPLVLILLTQVIFPAAAADSNGTLSTGLIWNFDSATGTLTITGEGEMPDYAQYGTNPPWESIKTEVKMITVSEGVTHIGNEAFASMINLHKVTLPSTLTSIGEKAFYYATRLKIITIPASVTVIGKSAFSDCENLTTVNVEAGLLEIGGNAFARCPKLASFTIPNTVTSIGDCAFMGCSKLTKITIPKSVTTIGTSAFHEAGLTECTFLGSPSLGDGLFGYTSSHRAGDLQLIRFCANAPEFSAKSLASVEAECVYPKNDTTWTSDTLQSYGGIVQWFESADPANAGLSSASTPKSGSCGDNAVWSLQNGVLTISGTGKITQIGWNQYKKDIKKVVVNDGITEIAWMAFYNCANPTEATIADSVTTLQANVFEQCPKLTSVKLPSRITTIPQSTFSGCTSLAKIDLPAGITEIEQDAFSNSGLVKIVLPDALVSIGYSAFRECTKLQEINFPKNLEELQNYAFYDCTSLNTIIVYCKPIAGYLYTFQNVKATAYYPEENSIWATRGGFGSGQIKIKPLSKLNQCNKDSHVFGDWVVTVEPTPDVDCGIKERVCTVCGYKQTVEIPVVENTTTPTTTAPATQPTTTAPPATEPDTSEPASTPTGTEQTKPAQTEATSPTITPQPMESDSDTVIIILGIVLGAGIIGGAAWYFLRKRN